MTNEANRISSRRQPEEGSRCRPTCRHLRSDTIRKSSLMYASGRRAWGELFIYLQPTQSACNQSAGDFLPHCLHLLLKRKCSQMLPLTHSLLWLLMRLCMQTLPPPHSLHVLLMRSCMQKSDPPHSLHLLLLRLCWHTQPVAPEPFGSPGHAWRRSLLSPSLPPGHSRRRSRARAARCTTRPAAWP